MTEVVVIANRGVDVNAGVVITNTGVVNSVKVDVDSNNKSEVLASKTAEVLKNTGGVLLKNIVSGIEVVSATDVKLNVASERLEN